VKMKNLNSVKYLKKDGDTPVENELPICFSITAFHIIYVYPKNITVLSKISSEIVFYKNFD